MPAKRQPLSPCPFCGARGGNLWMVRTCTADISDGHHVECRGCLARGPIVGAEPAARQVWNRRSSVLTRALEASHAPR